jgi:hypothetical protein
MVQIRPFPQLRSTRPSAADHGIGVGFVLLADNAAFSVELGVTASATKGEARRVSRLRQLGSTAGIAATVPELVIH